MGMLGRGSGSRLVRATQPSRHDAPKLATQALVQLGYPRPIAVHAVSAASGRDLETEALRRTGS
jgi:hypothetical protein